MAPQARTPAAGADEDPDEDMGSFEGDIVLLECPHCGEEDQGVLRAAPAGWTLRCLGCKAVRTVPAPPQARYVNVPLVLSEGQASRSGHIDVPLDSEVMVGDEVD